MQFGERVRELRKQRGLTQQKLAVLLEVSLSYISKVENERLNAGDYPSEAFVLKLAKALDADEDELLLLTDRVPAAIRRRIRERPDVFQTLASMDDATIDQLMKPVLEPDTK
ncbi:MAG: transcriptional regulator [Planctomyces sp.]|nr:transcriptional regulator [Planctomyces sp.]